jgi:hypothetical protein
MSYGALIVSRGPDQKKDLYVYPKGLHDAVEHARFVASMAERGVEVVYDATSTPERLKETYGVEVKHFTHCPDPRAAYRLIESRAELQTIEAKDVGKVEDVLDLAAPPETIRSAPETITSAPEVIGSCPE